VGPNEEQMIENAGRNAAMLALQALGNILNEFLMDSSPSIKEI
jgi:hypothetical protein